MNVEYMLIKKGWKMKAYSVQVKHDLDIPFWMNPYSSLFEPFGGANCMDVRNEGKKINAVLIGVFKKDVDHSNITFQMEELSELVKGLSYDCLNIFIQRIDKIMRSSYLGSGKLKEIEEYIKLNHISYAVCNDELNPSQHKQLIDAFGIPVIDKTMVVLEIFSRNSHSKEGKLQIELTTLKYLRNKINVLGLTTWMAADRGNGAFFSRGKGESVNELNQRKLNTKTRRIEREIADIKRSKSCQGKRRNEAFKIVLVGYTNAGKTTIMNYLTNEVLTSGDKLFLTTESTYRHMHRGLKKDILICDTVGFISNVSPVWIEGFQPTLDEIRNANLILHVIDISDKYHDKKRKIVQDIIDNLGVCKQEVVNVYNKIDKYEGELDKKDRNACYISATNNLMMRDLKWKLVDRIYN